jgi:hypothetical protein
MNWKQVNPEGEPQTPATQWAEHDIVKKKTRHNSYIRVQMWEFSADKLTAVEAILIIFTESNMPDVITQGNTGTCCRTYQTL